MKNTFYLIIFLITIKHSYSQVIVSQANTSQNTIQQLAQKIVGKGVKISNITFNAATISQAGSFLDNNKSSGFKSGIVLTNGSAVLANAPNNTRGAQANQNYAIEDLDLKAIFGNDDIFDQFVLEFDFVAATDSIKINYVFGSEEYNEYIGTRNDAMGIFLSGPGIVGTKNIAVLPDNAIVSVNTIHQGIVDPISPLVDFYWQNPKTDLCNRCQYFVFNPRNSNTLQYDGYTKPLIAKAKIQPCQTYHLKIGIADALDNVKDSGILIEQQSTTSSFFQANLPILNDTISVCQNDIKPILSANNGFLAYEWFFNHTSTGNFNSSQNTSLSGIYKVNITTTGNCVFSDSVFLKLGNEFVLTPHPDTLVCSFLPNITLTSKVNIADSYSYNWLHSGEKTAFSTNINPTNASTYTVTATNLSGCTKIAFTNLSVNPVFYNHNILSSANQICVKNQIAIYKQFSATDLNNSPVDLPSGISYKWIENQINTIVGIDTLRLKPTTLGINNIMNRVETSEGCRFQKELNFTVLKPIHYLKLAKDSICQNEQTRILGTFTGANFINWQSVLGINILTTSSPFVKPTVSTKFMVDVVYASPIAGCTAKDSVFLKVNPLPVYQKRSDTTVCKNEKINIFVHSTNNLISWKDSLNLPTNFERYISQNLKYNFSVSTPQNCNINDSIQLNIKPLPFVELRNDTALCFENELRLFPKTFTGNFNWISDADINNLSVNSINVYPKSTKKYYGIVENNVGCKATDSVSVTVFPLPQLPIITASKNAICEINQDFVLLNSTSFSKYLWNNGDTTASILIKKEGKYTLQVTDFRGCKNKDSIQIIRNCDQIYIFPNIITPNNDNRNESFNVVGIDAQSSLKIVDKWGNEVFKTDNYQNDWNAENLPDGIYFYHLISGKFLTEYKGWIQVLR